MRLLFCGDVVGRSGREAILHHVPILRERLNLDCVIVNGENAAHGFGISPSICKEFYKVGVDVITTGNHIWDQKEIIPYVDQDKRLLRPINFLASTPGQGFAVHTTPKGQSVLVINAMARLFMDASEDPFSAVDLLLKRFTLGATVSAIVLDFHGETTSEKMTMGHFCDGRVSFVVGTHTHVPTSDTMILEKGTAYQTDAGMCGDYNSVIGMVKETIIQKFTRKMPTERMTPAQGEATLCGTYVETDDKTGLATSIHPIRLGGCLSQAFPPL